MTKTGKDDLISRKAAKEKFNDIPPFIGMTGGCVQQMLDDIPAVDAVEVIRCKDCKHWHEETGWCNKHSHFIGSKGEACHPWESTEWKMLNADDFCSYGERKCNGC